MGCFRVCIVAQMEKHQKAREETQVEHAPIDDMLPIGKYKTKGAAHELCEIVRKACTVNFLIF